MGLARGLEPRVNGLGLEREHRKHAFVNPAQRLVAHESVERA